MRVLIIFSIFLFGISVCSFSQQSSWKYEDGWALKKEPGKKRYEKFFAIGTWGVPGYKYSRETEKDTASYNENKRHFLESTRLFNIVIMQAGFEKPYMGEVIKMVGTSDFPNALLTHLDSDLKGKNAYVRMQHLKKITNTAPVLQKINYVRDSMAETFKGNYIWSPIDEVANGRGWNWPVNIVEKIYTQIKQKQSHNLVYTDLMGTGKGNTFLFEQRYLKTHAALPEAPPYDFLKPEDMGYSKDSLLGFNQAYNGLPQYEFKNGTYAYKQYSLDTLKKLWFENIKQTAAGYKNGGDVFGVNAFLDFSRYPILSGITVDAIKAGINKNTPVWLYFDGNGYARGSNSIEQYTKMVKCQIYTSLIHGATGIMFWSDMTKDIANFNALLPVVEELKNNLRIIKQKTTDQKVSGDLHYMVKKINSRRSYLIATNTGKNKTQTLKLGGKEYVLAPLEVFISEVKR